MEVNPRGVSKATQTANEHLIVEVKCNASIFTYTSFTHDFAEKEVTYTRKHAQAHTRTRARAYAPVRLRLKGDKKVVKNVALRMVQVDLSRSEHETLLEVPGDVWCFKELVRELKALRALLEWLVELVSSRSWICRAPGWR